jgi:hypothetical protein
MAVWLRTRWNDGCGNSVLVALDGGEPVSVGNDGTYRAWHWIRGGRHPLTTGPHRLDIIPSEDGVAVDQILITDDLDYYPSGIVAPAGGADPTTGYDAAANEPPADRPEPRPYLAAVSGYYRSGFESVLVRLGIPSARVTEEALSDLELLERHDLLCLSFDTVNVSHLVPVLEEYVRRGGTLVLDGSGIHCTHFEPAADPNHLLRYVADGPRRGPIFHGCVLRADSTFLFEGVDEPEARSVSYIPAYPFRPDTDLPGAEVFGRLTYGGRDVGKAFMKRPFGEGKLYLLGLPLSVATRKQGGSFDRILANVILDAVGERCHCAYRHMPMRSEELAPGPLFADDFMRRRFAANDSWCIESGAFRLTGERPADRRHAFSLRGDGPGLIAAAGNPAWSDYRISASVLPTGAAGVWLTTAAGDRIGLVLDVAKSRLVLKRVGDVDRPPLAARAVPSHPGWRRLSLFARDGALLGYLDGDRLIAFEPAEPAVVRGPFGLAVGEGAALFDDVAARGVEDLLPGSDRAPGEEGSCLARSFLPYANVEPRSVYTKRWHLRAVPDGDLAVEPALPNYAPGCLMVDGKALAHVPACAERARILLSPSGLPQSDVAFHCPGWRDYVFADRLTGWYSEDGEWQSRPRWMCNTRYHWLGVHAQGRAVLWHKSKLAPPCAVTSLIGAAAAGAQGVHIGRDTNLVVAGDGRELDSGYCFRIGSAEEGCELRKGGRLLARAPASAMVQTHVLHVRWFQVGAIVEPRRLRFFFEDQLVIDYVPDEPVPVGQVGIWTQNNAISVARATLSITTADPPQSAAE